MLEIKQARIPTKEKVSFRVTMEIQDFERLCDAHDILTAYIKASGNQNIKTVCRNALLPLKIMINSVYSNEYSFFNAELEQ